MKKLLYALFFFLFLLPFKVDAKEINIYLFYGNGCPHCAQLEEYLDKNYKNDQDVSIYKYEVWFNTENQKIWQDIQNVTKEEAKGVPYFIIGDQVYQGYSKGEAWENTVDNAIKNAKENDYIDEVGVTLGIVKEENKYRKSENQNPNSQKEEIKNTIIDIPFIGNVDVKSLAVPIVAIIIGLVDGFNPCAMWILIFLITMLFDYKDKKKMWILGTTFLVTSAFIYFLFMISFLNVATFINSIKFLRLLVALFALIFGIYNIYRYQKNKKEVGCDVVNKDQRKKIMIKIKNILSNNSFVLALLGIMILSVSVNLIELLCSLGLPVMFTEILSYNNITGVKNILYIILYVIFFLLDDLIVFIIAMKTLKIKAISNKYSKYSHLIGGLIMIIIGLLMIFKPEWLMFNF